MKKLTKYFLQGLLYIAPFGITVYVIYGIFTFTDSLLNDTLEKLLKVDIPGLGLVIIIFLIIFMGMIGNTIFAKPFEAVFRRFIDKTPFLKVIYSSLNDLFSAFVGKEKKFNKPVLVVVNPLTNLEKFPHSYNFSGELYIVPKSQVKPVNIDPVDMMKFIVSAGISGWQENENKDI